MIYDGRLGLTVFEIVAFGIVGYQIYIAVRDKVPEIRALAPMKGLDEGVKRAAEMGRPIHVSIGVKSISGRRPGMLAAVGFLRYVCERAVESGAKVITSVCFPETIPLVSEIYREASKVGGVEGFLLEDDIRFLSSEQFAYATGVMGILTREHCATNFIFGTQAGSCMILGEVGSMVGAYQVSGISSLQFTSALLIASDYTFIGEEMYAASTGLSGVPDALGAIRAQDWTKFLILVLVILAALLATAGNSAIVNFLTS